MEVKITETKQHNLVVYVAQILRDGIVIFETQRWSEFAAQCALRYEINRMRG